MTAHKILASLLFAALAFLVSEKPAECHKNHCHGPGLQMCGGGWKDHPVKVAHVGPEGGADDKSSACQSAVEELEEKIAVDAHTKCPELHPCATCPSRCNGCKQENPSAQIADDKKVHKTPTKRADGSWECKVSAQVDYRCRCSSCVVKADVKE